VHWSGKQDRRYRRADRANRHPQCAVTLRIPLPSWYLVATQDQAIPSDAERQFATRMGATTIEIPSSHVPMVSHPGDVAQLIETAAEAAMATS